MFRSSQVCNLKDAYSSPSFDACVDIHTGYKTKNLLGAPVKNTKGTFGVLLALNKNNGNFSVKDEKILEYLATQAGVIMNNLVFYEKAMNNEKKAKALMTFVKEICTDLPGQSLALEFVRKAKDLLLADTCNIFLADYSSEFLIPIASDFNFDFKLPLYVGLLGEAIKTGKTINTNNEDLRFSLEFDEKFEYKTKTLLIVPILGENRPVGLIQLTNKRCGSLFGESYSKFDEDDIEILVSFSWILGKKLKKLVKSLSKDEDDTSEHAVYFKSSFGKEKIKPKPLMKKGIQELTDEEDIKT